MHRGCLKAEGARQMPRAAFFFSLFVLWMAGKVSGKLNDITDHNIEFKLLSLKYEISQSLAVLKKEFDRMDIEELQVL